MNESCRLTPRWVRKCCLRNPFAPLNAAGPCSRGAEERKPVASLSSEVYELLGSLMYGCDTDRADTGDPARLCWNSAMADVSIEWGRSLKERPEGESRSSGGVSKLRYRDDIVVVLERDNIPELASGSDLDAQIFGRVSSHCKVIVNYSATQKYIYGTVTQQAQKLHVAISRERNRSRKS
jgi:hypothetical protein